MASEGVHELPAGRHLAVDERGVGLRATWRLDRGFVNLSLWREGVCVETFHLTPAAAAELVAFLAHGLAEATAVAASASLHAVHPEPPREPMSAKVAAAGRRTRRRLAQRVAEMAKHIDPS